MRKFLCVFASLREITTFNLKKLSKLAWIRLMMIAAQLLLTGFAVHWLNMQYNERQVMLTRDVDLAWNDAQKNMIDSMLLKQYIEPAMDSNARYKFHFVFNTDSMHTMMEGDKSQLPTSGIPTLTVPAGRSRIIVNIDDSVEMKTGTGENQDQIFTRDLVLQGVKLFVNTHVDSSGKKPDLSSEWLGKPDTNLLKSAFTSRLSTIDPSIKIYWSEDSISDSTGKRKSMRYTMVVGENKLEAGVSGYRIFLVSEIIPQIAFALLLILLTATAFIISFRSLKSQIALNNQRNDFIRNMSHELKIPVATVKVALEALKKFNRSKDPAVMDEYLDMAASETNRLEMLISRVMNISAGNGEAIKLNPEPTDIKALIGEVLQSFKPRIEAEKATITTDLPDETILANIDRLHIQGVILNLIDNSLKYSIPPAEIEIRLIRGMQWIKISVSDKGIGIPEEYRSRIFEKFFRVPTGDLHNVKGYGLGLSYAEIVVKEHGGKISYQQRPGGGSIFEVSLPAFEV